MEDLSNLSLGRLICYPDAAVDELERRIGELRSLDVSGIILGGRSLVDGLPILGKGCTSTVVKAVAHGRFYALKARRTDSNRASMDSEAQLQVTANSISVGARLIGHTRNFILMELLEGWFVSEWLHGNPPMGELKAVLTRILYDCFKMDSAGLDHGELTDASKHIIVVKEGATVGDAAFKPVIIDFESASLKRRSRNVTSICQFLFLSDGGVKAPSIGGVNRGGLIEALKAYKARPSRETFNSILYSTGLMAGQ